MASMVQWFSASAYSCHQPAGCVLLNRQRSLQSRAVSLTSSLQHSRLVARSTAQANTTLVRISTLSARLMAVNMAEILLIVGLPDFDSIRCRLLGGL